METVQSFQKLTAGIFSSPTWDILLIFALIAGAFFYGISTGRRKIIAAIVHTYVAFALFTALPIASIQNFTGIGQEFVAKVGAFLLIFILLVILMGARSASAFSSASSWWQIFVMSFLQVGLLVHILLGFLPEDKIEQLAPFTKTVFAHPDYRLWWFFIPIIFLIIVRRLDAKDDKR